MTPFAMHLAAAYTLASVFGCEPQQSPFVHFVFHNHPPQFYTNRTTHELRAAAPAVPGVNLRDFPVTMGLTQGRVALTTSIDFMLQETVYGYCLWPREVDVTLSYQAQVYIAQEYAGSPCRYSQTRTHELRHVAADEDVINKYITQLRQTAAQKAAQLDTAGPFPAEQLKAVQNGILGSVNAALSRELQSIDAERGARQAAIDTAAEYMRLSRACPSEPIR